MEARNRESHGREKNFPPLAIMVNGYFAFKEQTKNGRNEQAVKLFTGRSKFFGEGGFAEGATMCSMSLPACRVFSGPSYCIKQSKAGAARSK